MRTFRLAAAVWPALTGVAGLKLRGSVKGDPNSGEEWEPDRQGFGGDPNFDADGSGLISERGLWEEATPGTRFRHMDDMDPIAPMDRLTQAERPFRDIPKAQEASEPTPTTEMDSAENAVFIPPYLRPDAFSHGVHGAPCKCGPPAATSPLMEAGAALIPGPHASYQSRSQIAENRASLEAAYGKAVVDEVVQKAIMANMDRCNCTTMPVYSHAKWEPIYNSSDYLISSADVTFGSGDYWSPQAKGGIVAPADKMPTEHYPLQARGDHIHMIPTTAREDRIADKFARYMDQIADRAEDCTNSISPNCTVACAKDDKVEFIIGNEAVEAIVLSTHVGNAIQIEFITAISQAASAATPTCKPWCETSNEPWPNKCAWNNACATCAQCPPKVGAVAPPPPLPCGLADGCTVFRPCRPNTGTAGQPCSEMEEVDSTDYAGDLHRTAVCPVSSTPCRTIAQLTEGKYLRKEGKTCMAEASGSFVR